MNTLHITDLAITQELDASAMRTVRGGTFLGGYGIALPDFNASKHDFTFVAEQMTSQKQDNANLTGNNVAFATDIYSTFKPSQANTASISF